MISIISDFGESDVGNDNWVPTSNVVGGTQISTVAMLLSFVVSVAVVLAPTLLARLKLPGNTVLLGNNSAVISATCHCIPIKTCPYSDLAQPDNQGSTDENRLKPSGEVLQAIATGKIRWGVVSGSLCTTCTGQLLLIPNIGGHLAFGVEEQNVTEPIEGRIYPQVLYGIKSIPFQICGG
jgi:hypothetical protein